MTEVLYVTHRNEPLTRSSQNWNKLYTVGYREVKKTRENPKTNQDPGFWDGGRQDIMTDDSRPAVDGNYQILKISLSKIGRRRSSTPSGSAYAT